LSSPLCISLLSLPLCLSICLLLCVFPSLHSLSSPPFAPSLFLPYNFPLCLFLLFLPVCNLL
jgi:hypothetical protein